MNVPAEGFKPPTLGAEIRCAIQLRHAGLCFATAKIKYLND